jgi:uncharacterized protein YbcC (UPF0753/DUF2309 family)
VSTAGLPGAHATLLADVDEAARVVAPLWPLSSFVAVNPLWGLRELPFDRALGHAARFLDLRGYPSAELYASAIRTGRVTPADLWHALGVVRASSAAIRSGEDRAADRSGARGSGEQCDGDAGGATTVARHDASCGTCCAAATDAEVARWCAAYVAGVLAHPAGGGLYAAWRWVVGRDPAARRLCGREGRAILASLPERAEDSILARLDRLDVAEGGRVDELTGQLARMPGWAGHALWRSRWSAPDEAGPALQLLDYLAVRLAYDAVLREFAEGGRGSTTRRSRSRGVSAPSGAITTQAPMSVCSAIASISAGVANASM